MTPLIFFGSDQYSAIVLNRLMIDGQRSTVNVITDQRQDPSPVEKLAKTHNLKVAYYPTNQDKMNKFVSLLESWFVDTLPAGLCASFDHLIPHAIIEKFGGHLYNLHPSLLPQYRNVSPVQYAIALGDSETGITLFRISTGIDNGEIISQIAAPILPTDTTPTLTSRLFKLGADLFLRFLGSDPKGSVQPRQNNLRGRSDPVGTLIFTKRLTRDSGHVEWPILLRLLQNQPINPSDTKNELLRLQKTPSLDHLLRALTPWPSIWSTVPTRKGDLRISLVPTPNQVLSTKYYVLISGKSAPISLADFTKYYL